MVFCKCGGEIKVIHSSNGTYGRCEECNYLELNESIFRPRQY